MKRKSYSSLSTRKIKACRVVKKDLPSVLKVWYNYPIVREYILPYIDEWTTYNLSRVDKTLSQVLRDTKFKDSRLSLLSQHFFKVHTCCICFGPTRSNTYTIEKGLYCHNNCVPKIDEWEINEKNIPIKRRRYASMGVIIRGYEHKNICFESQLDTLAYYIESIDKTVHTALWEKGEELEIKKYRQYFSDYYKEEDIKRGYCLTKKVNLGGVRVSVVMVFNHLYPTFYHKNNAAAIIEKYKSVEIRIKRVHDLLRIHFGTYIRPQLLDGQSWGKFFSSSSIGLVQRSTFLKSILSIGAISSPDKLIKIMDDNVLKVREQQVSDYCRKVVRMYTTTIACDCTKCRIAQRMVKDNIVIVYDMTGYLINDTVLAYIKIREHVCKILERYYDYWTRIRTIIVEGDTDIISIPLKYCGNTFSDFDSICTTVELLLNDGYPVRDIYYITMVDNVLKSYNDYKNQISLLIKNRRKCYCGNVTTIISCTKHKLCRQCCDNTACEEEFNDGMTDSESESESEISPPDIMYISD